MATDVRPGDSYGVHKLRNRQCYLLIETACVRLRYFLFDQGTWEFVAHIFVSQLTTELVQSESVQFSAGGPEKSLSRHSWQHLFSSDYLCLWLRATHIPSTTRR